MRIENVEFSYFIEEVGAGVNGFDPMYDPGNTLERGVLSSNPYGRLNSCEYVYENETVRREYGK